MVDVLVLFYLPWLYYWGRLVLIDSLWHCGTAHYGPGLSTRSGWRSAYAKALCPPMEWPASTWFGFGLGLELG